MNTAHFATVIAAVMFAALKTAPTAAAPPSSALSKEQWRQDLQYFAREMAKRHASAFHHVSKEHFEKEVADLDSRLDGLDADEMYVGMNRLANLIGDGHTYVQFPRDIANLPLDVSAFGDEYRVTHVASGLEDALGTRVLAVEALPMASAIELLETITPQNETPELRQARSTNFLTIGLVLHGLGITPDRRTAHFTLTDDAGKKFTIEVHALSPDAKPAWVMAYKQPPL